MIEINKEWKFKESFPSISAYTTAYNCLKNGYPIEKAIRSFAWADELIVVDGGSDDGTLEMLNRLAEELPHLQVIEVPIDWDDPGKDGALKAMSRAMTSSEFVIQFDADEFCYGKPEAWKRKTKEMAPNVDILNLFVFEPVGKETDLRLNEGHNPSKWRIFRNKPEITHGIPLHDRLEVDGKIYSKGGSDGCFPIHVVTNDLFSAKNPPYLTNLAVLKHKIKENPEDETLKDEYAAAVHAIAETEPMVIHVGHIDLEKKIRLYVNEWHKWWCGLYNKDPDDTQNNIYFPGVAFSDVTDEMIQEKAKEISRETPSVYVELREGF